MSQDYNLLVSAADDAPRRFSIGQKLHATITQLPSAEAGAVFKRTDRPSTCRKFIEGAWVVADPFLLIYP